MSPISGACACGKIEVEILETPRGPFQCYCRQCRAASGGNAAAFVIAPRAAVRIHGETAAFEAPTQSDQRALRHFCPVCGTPVFSELARSPDVLVIKLSVLDGLPASQTEAVFWTSEAPTWVSIDPRARPFATQP